MFEQTLNERQPRIDKLLLLAIAGLILIGLAFIYSATMAHESARSAPLLDQLWLRQAIWYGVGLCLAATLCLVDYRVLAPWAYLGYWIAILALVAVFFFGTYRGGARRWIDMGPFLLQPSEFAKLAFIFAMAQFLSRPAEQLKSPLNFWKPIGMMCLPFVLIMEEPDLGSALVLIPTGLAMMFCAGTPRRFLLRLIGAGGIVAALFLVDILFAPPGWQIKLGDYQRHRLLVYFGVDFAPRNASPAEKQRARELQRARSYQVRQAMIAVGSGGATGKGWQNGDQVRGGFLPPGAAHNDFIFSVIAEEKGFVGSIVVLTLYSVVLFSGIRIAGQARDRLGKLMAVGVVTLLFSHIFINIGMNIRIVPVTGIPLPLLSYGGSSVIASLIALGMLHNVYIHRKGY
ncbi:MAG TPA: rod shape-determining protein RodA [Verrucomicrobia bacterium]|nr:rod shape-determining protein RodA [Verrucomicrobiota bacterium]HOP97880.1 rod shape-determining protein RodA [Verrucomicrobiota bacterium]